MPTSAPIAAMDALFWLSSMSSTVISPESWCSSELIHRIKVDFPDPDGPQITIRSPWETFRSISLSAWYDPNHLLRRFISIAFAIFCFN